MAKILHLGIDPNLRNLISNIVASLGHEFVSFDNPDEAELNAKDADLIIVSESTIDDDHFNGLLFALDRKGEGKRVVIFGGVHKFSRIPFVSDRASKDPHRVRVVIEKMLIEHSVVPTIS